MFPLICSTAFHKMAPEKPQNRCSNVLPSSSFQFLFVMASEHVIPRSNAAVRREPPVPAGGTVWQAVSLRLSAGFFAPSPECNFSENGSVSKLSGSGQGFSLTSAETETAGWIHKRAVCRTICLLTARNIGSHQRVVSGEWHRPAWGGTCGPFHLLICPGHGDEGAAARAAIWPWPGNWVARRALCVSVTPSGPFENRCCVVCLLRYDSGGKTCLPVAAGFQESSRFWPWGCRTSIPEVRWD